MKDHYILLFKTYATPPHRNDCIPAHVGGDPAFVEVVFKRVGEYGEDEHPLAYMERVREGCFSVYKDWKSGEIERD